MMVRWGGRGGGIFGGFEGRRGGGVMVSLGGGLN